MFVVSAVIQIAASFCVFAFSEELLIIVFVDSKPSSAGVVLWSLVLWSEVGQSKHMPGAEQTCPTYTV